MSFSSAVISLEWNRNNLVLSRGESSLVISAEDVQTLRIQETKDSFVEIFRNQALKNRKAKRVFEAWERKESDLIDKLYSEVVSA